MSIFSRLTGEPVPEDLGKLPKEPSHFIVELSKRKYWRDIGYALLSEIARDANGNFEHILNFAYVSEKNRIVKTHLVPAAQSPDAGVGPSRVSFGLILCSLGSNLLQGSRSSDDRKQSRYLGMMADMAFTSATLCDPLQLNAYAYMATLYGTHVVNPKVALDYCARYKAAEGRLIRTPNDQLPPFYWGLKAQITDPARTAKFYERATGETVHANDVPTRKSIDDIEQQMRGRQ